MSKEVSYSDAREHLKYYMDYVVNNSDTIVISRRDSDDVVMMSRKDYDSMEETLYLLSIPKMRESIRKGLKTPVNKCSKEPGW